MLRAGHAAPGLVSIPATPSERAAAAPMRAYSPEAELSVLGGMLIEPDTVGLMVGILTPADFYREENRRAFAAMVRLHQREVQADPVTFAEELKTAGDLEAVGGLQFIASMADAVPSAVNIEYHAGIVRERSAQRRLAQAIVLWNKSSADARILAAVQAAADALHVARNPLASHGSRFVSDADVEHREPPPFLVDGYLTCGGLAVLYGPPGSGKSFVALDLAYCIAAGVPWLGNRVQAGPVAFIAAEGSAGLGPRIRAWKLARMISGPQPVSFLPEAVSLIDAGETRRLLRELKGFDGLRLVVIDTLARTMIGDENSALDMGRYIAAADLIRRETSAAVLVLHHTSKLGHQERGSTSLRGAADTMLAVRMDNDQRTFSLVVDKQKDAVLAAPLALALTPVDLPGGRASCVIVPASEAWRTGHSASLTESERTVLGCLLLPDLKRTSSGRWATASGVPARTHSRIIKGLCERGFVDRGGTAKRSEWSITKEGEAALSANPPLSAT